MADGLFGAPIGVGPATPLSTGSPEYQRNIVQNAQQQLAPMYRNALKQNMQAMSGRGLLDSGAEAQARLGTQEDYLRQMGGISSQAATRAADVAEQNRRTLQQQQYERQLFQDKMNFEREMADRKEREHGADIWSSLIGQTAGGLGGALFGPALGTLGLRFGSLFEGKPKTDTTTTPTPTTALP